MRSLIPLLILCIGAPDPITIEKRPPTASRAYFEHPVSMPTTRGVQRAEDAWCQFFFNCTVKLKYDVVEERLEGRFWHISAKIHRVDVTLTLENTLYLPRRGTEKLIAHEEGHRKINERVYESAEEAARVAARDAMSKTWHGTGIDEESAGKDATDKAVQEICDQYLNATADRALRVGNTYDDLTSHGKRMKPGEDEAIEKAFAADASKK